MRTPQRYTQANAVSLTRIESRLSFLYLDLVRVEQDDNGTLAKIVREDGRVETTYLPTAMLTCLLLGPGTSITSPAVAALSRNGCGISFVGNGVVRSYGTMLSPYAPTVLLEAQAGVVSDPARRAECARKMFLMRFHEDIAGRLPVGLSVESLRGMEGARMKKVYASDAQRARLSGWRRNYSDPEDAVNMALNFGNTALYGLVNAVVLALGMSPGLGVVHHGNRNSFVLDIADLYKTSLTIPLAFGLKDSDDPGGEMMLRLRDNAKLLRFLPRVIDDIHALMDVSIDREFPEERGHDPDAWAVDRLELWGPDRIVAAGASQDRRR